MAISAESTPWFLTKQGRSPWAHLRFQLLNTGENIPEALGYLASIERESDHPLAKAVLDEIGETEYSVVENTEVVKGGGIVATVNGHRVAVGNVALMVKENVVLNEKAQADIARLERQGNSLVLSAVDGELKILMGVRDQTRPGGRSTCKSLRNLASSIW